jgi:atypical dual specificity phosphatase
MPKSKDGPNLKKDAANLIFSPYLYLGPRSSVSLTFIAANAITHVLSIGSTPASTDLPVHYHRLSLSDDPSSSIDQVSEKADAIIEAAKDGRILVHYSAAVSRLPSIVAAYLMKKCDMALKDALGLIIRARPAVCPNAGFFRQLKEMRLNYKEFLHWRSIHFQPERINGWRCFQHSNHCIEKVTVYLLRCLHSCI